MKERDRDAEPAILATAEAFDDRAACDEVRRFHRKYDPTQVGPRSRAVRARSSCAGWVEQPTAEEFYRAIRSEEPSSRQRALVHTWLQEATRDDMLLAWAEKAYTWPELAAAIHRSGLQTTPRCADLNSLLAQ